MSEGNYRKLIVWQRAMELVTNVYPLTRQLPSYEFHGLSDQMRRAAVSIASNIAEGKYRFSKRERRHFYSIAYGSCAELETQLTIAHRLEFISQESFEHVQDLCDQILRMLTVLMKQLPPS